MPMKQGVLTITNDINTTGELANEDTRGLILYVPTGYAAATLTFYSRPSPRSPWQILKTSAGTNVTMAVTAGFCYECPASVQACGRIKIVSSVSTNNAVKVAFTRKDY